MADLSSYYYRTNTPTHMSTDLDIEPPRTRIAVACNRCRRRKIKCSGSPEGQSCEGCIRANNAECIFADRLQQIGLSATNDPPSTGPRTARLQPSAPVRSTSLPTNSDSLHVVPDPDRRTNRLGSHASIDGLKHSSPKRSLGKSCPQYPMSPPAIPKRQSLSSSATHPYSRPVVAGVRQTAVEQVSNSLMRYSQSLIQAQALQLSGQPQQIRTPPVLPTSVPSGYAFNHNTFHSAKHRPVPYPIQTQTSQFSNFNQPDYEQAISSPNYSDIYSPIDLVSFSGEMASPEAFSYSPMFQPSLYSANTPDLVSSDSISTMDSRSTSSLHSEQMASNSQTCLSQPYGLMDHSQYQTMPVVAPNQWTPGAEKMANQWLEFSPRQEPASMDSLG